MHIIAIAGPSGSGKTTIAKSIAQHYNSNKCIHLSMDNYYKDLSHLSVNERQKINYDDPDLIDFDKLIKDVTDLSNNKSISSPIYDFNLLSRKVNTVQVDPKPILIIEGIFALQSDKLLKLANTKIFIDADADTCLIRRIQRDLKERESNLDIIIKRYQTDVKPMFQKFILPCKEKADIVVVNNSDNFSLDTNKLFMCLDKKMASSHRNSHKKTTQIFCRFFHPAHSQVTLLQQSPPRAFVKETLMHN